MPLQAGQVLHNRYQIQERLGQGGMGAVYLAHDTVLEHLVAVKEMRPATDLSEPVLDGLRDQFKREARVLAGLKHPNLPRVIDYFTEGGNAYLVMDYVEGQSLESVLKAQGQPGLPEAQVLDWARQLLDALEYIHSKNVLHRDIKPANIRLTPEGHAVLVDFGLVKLYDPSQPQTVVVLRGAGTPQYAPPEQIDHSYGHTDARSDLFSLGATLYYLLTGNLPPSLTERLIKRVPIPPIWRQVQYVSPTTEAAIFEAMQLQPEDRFQSAAEMKAALAHVGAPPAQDRPLPSKLLPPTRVSPAPPSQPAEQPAARPTPVPAPVASPTPAQVTPPPPLEALPTPSPPAAKPRPKRGPLFWIGVGGCGCLMAIVLACAAFFGLGMLASSGATPTAVVAATSTPIPIAATDTPLPFAGPQFARLEFASEVIDDSEGLRPVEPAVFFSDVSRVYAFWEYQGTQDGVDLRRVWIRDGEAVLDKTDPWDGGESGTYYVYLFVDSGTLKPGDYALKLYYDGELLISGDFEIDATGQIEALYADDFEDPASGWDVYDDPDASAGYEDGRYAITIISPKWIAWANPGLFDLGDVEIEVEATFTSGSEDNEFGVICRYLDGDNFYYLVISADGYAGITRVENDDQTIINSADGKYQPVEAVRQGSATNHLRAVCVGSTLQLYANGELVAEATDTTFLSGDVGLIVGAFDEGNVRVEFDNLTVWEP